MTHARPGAVPVALWVALAIGALASTQLTVMQKINWDEFLFLSRIYSFQTDTLREPVQNFHVHFLGWLTALPGSEATQIRAGRAVMWLCQAVTCGALYACGRAFLPRAAALFAVCAYLGMGFTLHHGTSFRADPMAAALLMTALAVCLRAPLVFWAILLVSGCLALAVLITIKAVFYAPAFVCAALWRWRRAPGWPLVGRFMAILGTSLILCGALYLWHQTQFETGSLKTTTGSIVGAGQKVLRADWNPGAAYLLQSVKLNPIICATLVAGAVIALRVPAGPVALGLAAPLLSFAIYRNAFPYYFPFIFAPAMILAGLCYHALRPALAQTLIILVCLGTVFLWALRAPQTLTAQARTLEVIHRIFPEPVRYIDRALAVPSFPHAGFFMSTWGMDTYHARAQPILARALEDAPVPLLLVNGQTLADAVDYGLGLRIGYRPLLEADAAALRANFVPHWGPVWVAGKHVPEGSGLIEIVMPGLYTLEADADVSLNGRRTAPLDVVFLERGSHRLASSAPQPVTLRWGAHLFRPADPPPSRPFFTGF